MEALKPCPFCGGEAEIDTYRPYRNISTGAVEDMCAIYCGDCGAELGFCYRDAPSMDRQDIVALVTDAWNRREPLKPSSEGRDA